MINLLTNKKYLTSLSLTLLLTFTHLTHPKKLSRKEKRTRNIAKRQQTVNDNNGLNFKYELDKDKDSLVTKIIQREFNDENVRVVSRDNYHGAVKNTLIHGRSNNRVHKDSLEHGETYIQPILDKKEAEVISLGTTLHELAGGGKRLVEECLRNISKLLS